MLHGRSGSEHSHHTESSHESKRSHQRTPSPQELIDVTIGDPVPAATAPVAPPAAPTGPTGWLSKKAWSDWYKGDGAYASEKGPTGYGSREAWSNYFTSKGAYAPKTAWTSTEVDGPFNSKEHIRAFSLVKAATYGVVAGFGISEYFFYLFNLPFTKSEMTSIFDNVSLQEYLTISLCAADSIVCTQAGANVDGTLGKLPVVKQKLHDTEKYACTRNIIIAALELSLVIGSSSVASGKPPHDPEEWTTAALLMLAQLALYQVTTIPSICIAIPILLNRASTAAGEALLHSRFDAIPLSRIADLGLSDLPAYAESKSTFYKAMDFLKFFPGFVTRGGFSWGVLGFKLPPLFSADATEAEQYAVAGVAAALGLLMQTLTVAPITYDTSRAKARLAGFELEDLKKIQALTKEQLAQLDPAHAAEIQAMQASIIKAVIRDKERGTGLAFTLNLLPDFTWNPDCRRTALLTNALVTVQYANRIVDFAAFIQHFIGTGPAQEAFAYTFAFLAASQLATQMSMLGVGAAKALADDGRYLYATATRPLFECCTSTTRSGSYHALEDAAPSLV